MTIILQTPKRAGTGRSKDSCLWCVVIENLCRKAHSKIEIKRKNIMSSSEGPEQRPIIPARQARQGVTGHNVRLVLGVSLAAIVIVFAIIWIVYFA
jgi:hypothetical protein